MLLGGGNNILSSYRLILEWHSFLLTTRVTVLANRDGKLTNINAFNWTENIFSFGDVFWTLF